MLADQVEGGSAASVESKAYTAEKAQHATDALRRQREDMYLRAPRAGVIGYRNAETGAIVSAGTKVFSLVDTSHINVDCTIAEADAAILKAGLFAHTAVDILQRRATLCVPKEALLSRTGRQVLFVVREDGTVEERAVKVGLMNELTKIRNVMGKVIPNAPQEVMLVLDGSTGPRST